MLALTPKLRAATTDAERQALQNAVTATDQQIDALVYEFYGLIEADEDGVFVAECPSLPGCVSQGKTRTEALANIKDAMAGYLASLKKHGEPVPLPISEEIVEIPA
jgi:predicted RNase H-like HicB family nuclease